MLAGPTRAQEQTLQKTSRYSTIVKKVGLLVASYGGENACQFRVAAGDRACTCQLERRCASTVRCAPCDAAALNGRYVFTGRGFIEAVQPGIQRMHYGVFVFDGAGKLTGKQSSSRGGKIGREKLEGSYTLTLGDILAGQTHWDLYLTEDRKRGHIIRMDEGNMAVRSFER